MFERGEEIRTAFRDGRKARNQAFARKSSGEVCPCWATCSGCEVLPHLACPFPHSPSLWREICLLISRASSTPQAQWSEDKDEHQATCVHHSCRAAPAGCGGHLGRVCRAGQRQELGLDAKLPHFLGALSPTRLGTPWGKRPCLPHQVKGPLSTEVLFSPSLRCEERQGPLIGLGSALLHHAVVQGNNFSRLFLLKSSPLKPALGNTNISSSFPHCYPECLSGTDGNPILSLML